MALPPFRCKFCATCGVTPKWRHSVTKSRVSKPLSPPTVTCFSPGICSNITSAAFVLVREMESLGESYPTELLQNHETRMRVSDAIKYLREAIEWTSRM